LRPQTDVVQLYRKRVLLFLKTRGLFGALLSLDVLGNPEQAFSTIRGGFEDLFYEPVKAVVVQPSSFGRTVAFGAKSFGRSIVGGVSGAASKITGAVGSGIAVLGMDKEHQRERMKLAASAREGGIGDGVKAGMLSFGLGLKAGVSGLWEMPMKGARESGVLGGVVGVGKGVFGLVTKPIGGTIDLLSNSLSGVEAAASGPAVAVKRMRPPRFIPARGAVTPFSQVKVRIM
jgi:vacuolar protein sorting-associated protein 13A/C